MKSKFKTILAITLTSGIIMSSSISSYAQTHEPNIEFIAKPINNDGKLILAKNNEAKPEIPSNLLRSKRAAIYPEYYNLFEQGKATNAKHQGNLGLCWAFGSLSSVESSILMKDNADGNIDLSERHLGWFNFNGKDYSEDDSLFAGKDNYSTYGYSPYDIGGSYYNSAATLMRRYGASDETICSYEFTDDGKLDDCLRTNSNIYLDSVEILPSPTYYESDSAGDISAQGLVPKSEFDFAVNSIKEKLMSVGAVDFSFYEGDSYYNRDTYGYYFDGSIKTDSSDNGFRYPNHEISIVGWDDNYSKENFNTTPPENGAWIAKNSWGENWANNGFFYISYYDIGQCDFASFMAEDTKYQSNGSTKHLYKNIYQYDGTIFGATQVSTTTKIEAANVFTSRDNEILEAISSATLMPYSTFHYKIYTDLEDENDPTSGNLVHSGSKTYANAGYYTIPLDKQIVLDKGEEYSIIISISFNSDGITKYVLPCEMNYYDAVELDITEDVSFYSVADTDWNKINPNEKFCGLEIGNAIVKAYTNDSYKFGDPNKDGTIDIDDVSTIQCYVAKLIEFDEYTRSLAELDNDNIISISDATYLQMKLSKII